MTTGGLGAGVGGGKPRAGKPNSLGSIAPGAATSPLVLGGRLREIVPAARGALLGLSQRGAMQGDPDRAGPIPGAAGPSSALLRAAGRGAASRRYA